MLNYSLVYMSFNLITALFTVYLHIGQGLTRQLPVLENSTPSCKIGHVRFPMHYIVRNCIYNEF